MRFSRRRPVFYQGRKCSKRRATVRGYFLRFNRFFGRALRALGAVFLAALAFRALALAADLALTRFAFRSGFLAGFFAGFLAGGLGGFLTEDLAARFIGTSVGASGVSAAGVGSSRHP